MSLADGVTGPLDGATQAAVSALVRQHASTFPWYRELLRERGLRDTAPLTALPIIGESLLNEHYYGADHTHLPDAARYFTSGTTGGGRKQILYSRQDHEKYIEHRRAVFTRFLASIPVNSIAVADLGTGHAAASARRIFEAMKFRAYDVDFSRPITTHIELLNAWQPDVLFTMPMILDRLCNSPQPLLARPRKVIVLGDVAPANWRRQVAERFGIKFEDILDVVGSIEVGAIAYYCAETGRYHFHDHIVPEVRLPSELYEDCDVRLAGAGPHDGILLLTSLARQYFPALRFATNDVIRGLRRMTWSGCEVYAFDRVEGRFGGEVKHGERISHHDICAAVNQVFPGALFDVRDDGRLEIGLAVDELTEAQVTRLRAALASANPDVDQMIESGLVGEIAVSRVPPGALSTAGAKRSFTVKRA
jgi:phenylacetate-coenzyme A ligase PaaK-like adenylate-forming protein